MSWPRSLLLATPACLSLLIMGALTRQSAQPSLPPPVLPAVPDAGAAGSLDEAIARLDPHKIKWMKTSLWQEVNAAPLQYQAEGTYVVGPDHRVRLDLKVHLDAIDARLQVVCDGRTLWQSQQTGDEQPLVSKVAIPPVLDELYSASAAPQVRDRYYRSQLFSGLSPLLLSLREQLVWTSKETTQWQGKDVIRLTGVRADAAADQPWPEHLARQCRLLLDADTHWPLRIEWWGPTAASGADTLLLQMEFRDPVLQQEMPPGEFAFTPSRLDVQDMTDKWTVELRARSQQVAAQQPPPRTIPPLNLPMFTPAERQVP